MQCPLLLILSFLPAVCWAVKLETQRIVNLCVPTNVTWTRENGDPTLFDLRFVHKADDLGFATTINATGGEPQGKVPVTFKNPGRLVLVAVDFNNDNKHIGMSNAIFVRVTIPVPVASSVLSQSSTTTPTVTVNTITMIPSSTGSSSAGGTMTPSSASSISRVNTTAIVGGVLGGIILILLAILFVLVKRKETRKRKRLTFKRDLMVQDVHQPPVAPDIEEGRGIGTSPILPPLSFQPPFTASTPQKPTRSQFRASVLNTPVPSHPPTHRQVQLGTRIVQLENQISSIRRQNRGQEGMELVLEHMKKQVEWLRAERDSPWARCETDVPHPLLERYIH